MLRFLSLFSFIMMLTGIIGMIYLHVILQPLPWLIALQAAAVLLMFWARATFGLGSFHLWADPTEDKLITGGPYRWIRHPIYAAVLLFSLPAAIVAHSPLALAFGGLITLGAILRMLCEEQLLRRRYPEWEEYARRTRRVIPWLI